MKKIAKKKKMKSKVEVVLFVGPPFSVTIPNKFCNQFELRRKGKNIVLSKEF